MDGQPYEVLDFRQMGKAQDMFVAQTKIKNLITGKVFEKNFHQGDNFQEAELEKMEVKFIYLNREKVVFSEVQDPKKRFDLTKEQVGEGIKFLKPNEIVTGVKFQGNIVSIVLPIKVQLKVTEAPPSLKGDRAQAGTKSVTLETGAKINVPLFIETGDVIELNTETEEYTRRV